MKQKLLNSIRLRAMMLVAVMCAAFAGQAWADSYTIGWGTASGSAGTYTNFTATSGTVTNIVSFSTAKNDGTTVPAYNSKNNDLRLYYHSEGNGGSITLTPADGITITGAVVTTSTAPSVKYSVDGGSATAVSCISNTYTISGINANTSLTIQNVNTTNTQLRIKTIAITYESSSSAESTTTTISDAGISYTNLYVSTDAGSLSAVVKDASSATIDGATVTWSGNNDAVATINAATGAVTLVGAGTVTFTATYAGVEDVYSSSTGTYEMTVTNEDPSLEPIWSEDFSDYAANAVPSEGSYNYACTNGGGTTKIYTENSAGGTSPELLVAKTNGTFSATIPLLNSTYAYDGDLVLTFKSNAQAINVKTTTDGLTVSGEENEGDGVSFSKKDTHTVTFQGITTSTEDITIVFTSTSSSNVRLDDIVLKGKKAELTIAATPVITPATGAVASGQEVTITCATDGASIHYTTDGSTPTSSSTLYDPESKPTITAATTIKAIAIKDGLTNSAIAEATYTIAEPCAVPTFSVAEGEVAIGTKVSISCATEGATIYYTTDGTTPTTSSNVYSSAITINNEQTIKAIAAKEGNLNSDVASATYSVPNYATLPFSYNSGSSSIGNSLTAGTLGLMQSGLGSDYSTTNTKLKFDNTDDCLILKYAESANVILTFNIKGNSFSDGTFKVQYSEDGSSYTDLKSYTSLGDDSSESIDNIPASARYIKWIYTEKSYGNVGLGNISLNECEPITVSGAGYTTHVTSHKVSVPDGVTAYIATATGASTVTLSTIEKVPASTAIILKAAAGSYKLPVITTDADDASANILLASDGSVKGDEEGTIFALGKKNDVVGFYLVNSGQTVPAGKAYLEVDGSNTKGFTFDFDGLATGINTVQGSGFKVQDSKIYNLAGQRVDGSRFKVNGSGLKTGIYIVNGKKVLVK